MSKYRRLNFRGYDGLRRTSHHIQDVLPSVLKKIGHTYSDRGDLILSAWPEIIGPRLASKTEPVSFREGILKIRVSDSTLYFLLKNYERTKILENLRKKFPRTSIKNIFFRMG